MRAFVLLKVSPQETAQLMQDLKQEERIQEANLIHGPYDCVLEVDGKDLEAINGAVMRIRSMPGVTDTLTCLVIQSWQRPLK